MLITNSEWGYTLSMMSYAFDRFVGPGRTWRDLFDVVIVGAGSPRSSPPRRLCSKWPPRTACCDPQVRGIRPGAAYFGGSAQQVEAHLGLSGDEILYVGDHMFGDVHVTKSVLRWRTALILRELEDEIAPSLRSAKPR